jgi:hypothetical protein
LRLALLFGKAKQGGLFRARQTDRSRHDRYVADAVPGAASPSSRFPRSSGCSL